MFTQDSFTWKTITIKVTFGHYVFEIEISALTISRKIWLAEKYLNFHTVQNARIALSRKTWNEKKKNVKRKVYFIKDRL